MINIRRKALLLCLLIFPVVGTFSSCGGNGTAAADGETTISGTLTGCISDSIYLYETVAYEANKVAAAKIGEDNTFTLTYKADQPGFFILGSDPRNALMLILGEDNAVQVTGNCANIGQNATLSGSPINDGYTQFTKTIRNQNQRINKIAQNLQVFSRSNPQAVPQLKQEMTAIHQEQTAYLDSLRTAGGLMGKVASIIYYPPFGTDPSHSTYSSELEYFAQNFVVNVDLNDPVVQGMPQVYDRFSNYTSALLGNGFAVEATEALLRERINSTPQGSKVRKLIYLGALNGAEQSKKDELYLNLANDYLAEYSGNSISIQQVQQGVKRRNAFRIGSVPPDIDLATPEGGTMALSSLKGKVVLIDFWASWCRPCRRENPNVVRMYNKYKAKGFDIYSVSLDKKKAPWLTAIEQDGMIWNHVSDLKGWQCVAAADYGVSSIPATFLVDQEGKLIGKGLRGDALEKKLEEVFAN